MEIRGVTSSIVEYLKVEIITGKLAPGQKLNEILLSSNLGVSRPPLREAFRILEQDHLVVSIPRKGTYVSQVSKEDFQNVHRAREMIECYVIDLLKTKNIRQLPQVVSSLAKSANLSIANDAGARELLTYREAFADYHFKLVESGGNARITGFYQTLSSSIIRYEYMGFSVPEAAKRSLEDHQQLLDLIKAGDYDRARECLRTHIAYVAQLSEGIFTRKDD